MSSVCVVDSVLCCAAADVVARADDRASDAFNAISADAVVAAVMAGAADATSFYGI